MIHWEDLLKAFKLYRKTARMETSIRHLKIKLKGDILTIKDKTCI